MELKDLVNAHELSGVDYNCEIIRFCLDEVTYEAEEDPADGYRSYIKELRITDKPCKNTFPPQPVTCEHDDYYNDILTVRDSKTGLIILRVGTENVNDYYPLCIMEYHPENMACNENGKIAEKIIEHIMKQDKEGLFNRDDGESVKAIVNYYYYVILKWCGCGDPATACRTIKELLYAFSDFDNREARLMESFGVDSIYDNPLVLCLAYSLDAAGFIEHGTGIGGSWLTDDGKYFLWAINEADEELNDL